MRGHGLVIDPGHGGLNGGCMIGNIREADYVLALAHMMPGVQYTRVSNTDVSLGERGRIAKELDADLVVSLHVDSRPGGLRGISFYYWPGNERTKELCRDMYEVSPATLKFPPGANRARPIIRAGREPWQASARNVLRAFECDAILIEIGDCDADYEALMDHTTQTLLCATIMAICY